MNAFTLYEVYELLNLISNQMKYSYYCSRKICTFNHLVFKFGIQFTALHHILPFLAGCHFETHNGQLKVDSVTADKTVGRIFNSGKMDIVIEKTTEMYLYHGEGKKKTGKL